MRPKRSWPAEEFMIKVCGVTGWEDARLAVECGANALGFNFYPRSPRYLPPEQAQPIIAALPESVRVMAVMVVRPRLAPGEREPGFERLLRRVKAECDVDVFQLHGVRTPREIPPHAAPVLVATPAAGAHRFPQHEILIDTSWGRGKKEDWNRLRQLRRPFILSGGLTPDNVVEALEQLHPSGVDVCSGVERKPGMKDPDKLAGFIRNVRRAIIRTGSCMKESGL